MSLRQAHLVAPGLVRHPALGAQLVGRRAQRIRHRAPDVLAAVAVEVVGDRVVFRRHELGEAHGAGPRSRHGLARAHAVLQHLQRVQQLGAEQLLAAAEIGLGGERLDDVVGRLVHPERRLPAPDRQHELALHAELAPRSWRATVACCVCRVLPCSPSLARKVALRYWAGVLVNSACPFTSLLPGSTRSGSARSGSTPRKAASNVARDTPMVCASGHSVSRKRRKASGACASAAPTASRIDSASSASPPSAHADKTASPRGLRAANFDDGDFKLVPCTRRFP